MATIGIEGIRFFGYHGAFPEEQDEGNEFEMDLYIESGQSPPVNDQLDEVLDYAEVYQVAIECTSERANLLETLVMRIGRKVLEFFPEIRSLRVRLAKLDPPLTGECRRVYAEETFHQ